ncbi:hypothetical protein CYLTODRAFT_396027 [Cylindrobasidium torrendii FP15055 ss-10]|uniref:CHAT domain-containing protein n=1 Tax=Cylindrobasidium torrendii FP15055 ss-10 TaxID=1314674 RepID=A0A0D7BCS1_9AGAR|nr:hypothetical protein CYLTODRAFT_396027 [Cylindrobasidium torrendii FP15055 ss-10]
MSSDDQLTPAIRLALQLSMLPSDNFDEVLAHINNSLPYDIWDEEAMAKVDPSVLIQDMDARSARMSPEDKINTADIVRRDFETTGDVRQLESAISLTQQALAAPNASDEVTRVALHNLNVMYNTHFQRTGDFQSLNASIDAIRKAVDFSQDNEGKAEGLYTLGGRLTQRFEALSERDDLEAAIAAYVNGLSLLLPDDNHRALFSSKITASLKRYLEIHHSSDALHGTIASLVRQDSHIDAHTRAIMLGEAAEYARLQFEQVGTLQLLEDAITLFSHATNLSPDAHQIVSALGVALLIRFERLGEPADLDTAIELQQRACSLVDDNDDGKPGILHNLGNILQVRFSHTGRVEDIDEAINVHIRSVYHFKNSSLADTFPFYSSLGTAYHRRYDHLRHPEDINKAAEAKEKAVSLVPDDHPARAQLLNGYGSALLVQYTLFHGKGFLDEAVSAHRAAVELTPRDHATRVPRLHNLVQTLQARFRSLGDLDDIQGAVNSAQEVVSLIPDDSIQRKAVSLFSLGVCWKLKYTVSFNSSDLDGAISAFRRAAEMLPLGLETSKFNTELGTMLLHRSEQNENTGDRDEAVAVLDVGAHTTSSPIAFQFVCAIQYAQTCTKYREAQVAMDAYTHLFGLIPRVIWIGDNLVRRFEDIHLVRGAVNGAVAHAISSGEIKQALEWAEQGRCVVWNQILQLRRPTNGLEDDLAAKLKSVADELQKLGMESHSNPMGGANAGLVTQILTAMMDISVNEETVPEGMSREDFVRRSVALVGALGDANGQRQRSLTLEYESLLQQAQALPGHDQSIRPKHFEELRASAKDGPVVLFNLHSTRCDALVLVDSSEGAIHVPLTTFTRPIADDMLSTFLGDLDDAGLRSRSRGFSRATPERELRAVLAGLWRHVVEPVLQAVKPHIPEGDNLPRITWCTSGELTFLPLHAAGLYNIKGASANDKAFKHIMSSYTPSVTALLDAQQRARSTIASNTPRLLAVSQPTTPEAEELPATVEEVKLIGALVPGMTWLNDTAGTREAVLHGLREHNWVHLSCHGVQNMEQPLKSAFLLQDGGLELVDIMKESFGHTQLAFLSACRTAAGDEQRPEEAVHLAAGMLMAGFQNVVATLWSIGDEDALFASEQFYSYLMEKGNGDSGNACRALHHAASRLRERVGDGQFLRWAPFVHIGA